MTMKVYFAKLSDGAPPPTQAEALERVLNPTGFVRKVRAKDMVAIKIHIGEKNNVTHIRPEVVAKAVALIKKARGEPFITDTATLYRGQRENAILHALLAAEHGFGPQQIGAPFIPLDGLSGNHEVEVQIGGELNNAVKIAGDIPLSDALIAISHATGHMTTGFGAAIKNVGMGLSSRAGKMRQHSSVFPEVIVTACQGCKKCIRWCPQGAIVERDKFSFILSDKCIGCGQCIAVCRFGAIKVDYAISSPLVQKNMAEHAAGVLKLFGDKAVFINVMVGMTTDCDCLNVRQNKVAGDVGLLASADIVAVDQATLDLTGKAHRKNISELSYPDQDGLIQIRHAEKLGLGTAKYDLVEV
jgi:uncharacterized Fe-S center protein